MKQLQITETNAIKLYKSATPEFKATLEDTFGKEFFSGNIMDRIKTYEDACAEIGEQPVDEKKLKELGFTDDEITYRKIKTITKALNEGWNADWKNTDQYKYYPWFRMSSGSFVFSDAGCAYSYALAGNGSRLCFKSSELAEYAGKQFLSLYSYFILNQ